MCMKNNENWARATANLKALSISQLLLEKQPGVMLLYKRSKRSFLRNSVMNKKIAIAALFAFAALMPMKKVEANTANDNSGEPNTDLDYR